MADVDRLPKYSIDELDCKIRDRFFFMQMTFCTSLVTPPVSLSLCLYLQFSDITLILVSLKSLDSSIEINIVLN